MAIRKKILLLTGSMNQTTQMLKIAEELKFYYDCWFSQAFSDNLLINLLTDYTTLLDKTIIARPFRKAAEQHITDLGYSIDYRARKHNYDLVLFCSDLLVPKRLRAAKTIWIQEGMIDRMTGLSRMIHRFRLPPILCCNTSLNGSRNICDLYCTASYGYREHLVHMGTDLRKVVVTGMSNYDHAEIYRHNDFPHKDYVMVATTDMRETARKEDRPKFIRSCVAVANGRPLLFKLHPNEEHERAVAEIKKYAPKGTLIYTEGNTHEMIANCCELITQYSTVVYTGIALGKKVHSWFDVEQLYKLAPIQNGGSSAHNIARVCRQFIAYTGAPHSFIPEPEETKAAPKALSYAG